MAVKVPHAKPRLLVPNNTTTVTTTNMSKLLVVFGATGQQGGSVVDYVINDPELSKQYRVRGVTRDPSKPAAQALRQKGVELVQGDLDHAESVAQALQGSHTVFLTTNTIHQRGGGIFGRALLVDDHHLTALLHTVVRQITCVVDVSCACCEQSSGSTDDRSPYMRWARRGTSQARGTGRP